MHIRLHYLYRDASNYKRHNWIVFSNPDHLSLEEIDTTVRSALIEGEWFLHTVWNVPDMHFEKTDWENDHPWHEYDSVEGTNEHATQAESISSFLLRITAHNVLSS